MDNHPIIPSSELIKQLETAYFDEGQNLDIVLIQAYQAGADRELEACCHWLGDRQPEYFIYDLRAARRPAPEPQAEGEVEELVVWLRRSAGCADESPKDLRAADLLERQHFLVSQPPTDQELLHEWELVPGARAYEDDVIDFARAVLSRWGNS